MKCKVYFYCIVGILATSQAQADVMNPYVPDWRGDAGTVFHSWDSFGSAFGAPNLNDSGDPGGMLFNYAQGAMITGTGNIYNQAGGLEIHIYGYSPIEQAVLHTASMGTEMDYANVYLYVGDGENGQYFSYDSFATNHYEEVPQFGANVTTSYSWDLSDYNGEITEWAFFVNGVAAHNVLDAVTVDIFMGAVPAPGAFILLGVAGLTRKRRI